MGGGQGTGVIHAINNGVIMSGEIHMRSGEEVTRQRSKKAGFTLVEVVIAITIFTVTALGFTYGFLQCYRSQYSAKNHYRALLMARNRVQLAITHGYENLWSLEESNVSVNADGELDSEGLFRRTSTVDTNYMTNCFQFQVSVRWPVANQTNQFSDTPVTVTTLIVADM